MSVNKHLQYLQSLVQEFASDYEIKRTKSGHFAVEVKVGAGKRRFLPQEPPAITG